MLTFLCLPTSSPWGLKMVQVLYKRPSEFLSGIEPKNHNKFIT